jgi:hypothetical protein
MRLCPRRGFDHLGGRPAVRQPADHHDTLAHLQRRCSRDNLAPGSAPERDEPFEALRSSICGFFNLWTYAAIGTGLLGCGLILRRIARRE